MPNTIALAKKYTNLLDEVYAAASLTADLESDGELVRDGANANEIVIPKLSMDGLGDYDRNSGYTNGNVDLAWETQRFNYERSRMFTVDNLDDEETQNVAFGRLAGEFERTKVVPELDAFRFATYASATGVGTDEGTFATGAEVIAALSAASAEMDDASVPQEGRILYISAAAHALIRDMDTTKSREVLACFDKIVKVPSARFFTKIKLLDGKTEGEKTGGYQMADDGAKLNFLIVHKEAVLQFTKHAVPSIFPPDVYQKARAWAYAFLAYGIAGVFENKAAGIYAHSQPVVAVDEGAGEGEGEGAGDGDGE